MLIPAGTFEMGSNLDGMYGTQPVHRVTLTKAYCMDRTEVTQSAYWACQKAGKCRRSSADDGTWPKHYPNRPADFVNWKDAVTYCAWRRGRLPTEAEWEFAARGVDGRLYPWGNETPTNERWQVRPKGTRVTVSDVGTHPKGRSPFGLEDMAGNVSEWVYDCLAKYGAQPAIDPRGPEPCDERGERVQRGATWASHFVEDARLARRYPMPPHDSSDQTGFRCAYDLH